MFASKFFFHKVFLYIVNLDTFECIHIYAHSNLQAPPIAFWKVTRTIGEIKFSKIFA